MKQLGDRRSTLAAATILMGLAAWILLGWPWLLGDVTIPYDAKAHFHPQLQFLAHALHSGQSPFWTPHIFAGSPQIADPQSLIFSPALLLALTGPAISIWALDAFVLILVGIGGLATFFLFYDRGWHPAGGLIAGLGVAFGASASWRIQHIGQIQSYALFLVSLWALTRALDRKSPAYGIVAGGTIGLMIAQPDQVAFLAGFMLVGFAVTRVFAQKFSCRTIVAYLPTLSAIAIAALIIAVVPLTLTYLFVSESSRAEISLDEVVRGSLHPASLLTGVIGDLFGAHDPGVDYWGPYSEAWDLDELTLSQNMSQIYVGALPALLILTLGVVRGIAWHADIRFFSAALLVMLFYALGGFTPVFQLFYEYIPGVSLFRRPADATFMIGACLSIVGGYVAHRLAIGDVAKASRIQAAVEAGVVATIFIASAVIAYGTGRLVEAARPMMVAAAFLLTAAAVIRLLSRHSTRRAFFSTALLGIFSVVDLSINNGPNDSTALPATHYDFLRPDTRNDILTFVKSRLAQTHGTDRRDRVELTGIGFSWPNLGLIHNFDHVLGYNPLRLRAATAAIGAGDTIAGWDQRRFTALFPSYNSQLAHMLGLRYIVTPVPIERIDAKLRPGALKLVHRTRSAYIYENAGAMPRAMFVSKWIRGTSEKLIETGVWPAFDPYLTVLLDADPAQTDPAESGTNAAVDVNDKKMPAPAVSIRTYKNTVVEIAVSADNAGFVVLNDMWHPWWRATVDGNAAPVLKANALFRAVHVSKGQHLVRFDFRPIAGAIDEISNW